jgi:hypothetical protein
LISVDGRSVQDLMTEFSRFLQRGSPVSSQRSVADLLTFRPQSRIPRVIDLPDTAIVVIEQDGGETKSPYLQQNTDGLVVDVMRNTCGGCYMLTAASHLIPYPFFFFGEELRVTIAFDTCRVKLDLDDLGVRSVVAMVASAHRRLHSPPVC